MSNNIQKKFNEYSELKKIPSGSVTYLFKLNDGRLCVCSHEKKIKIYKFENNDLIEQISIPKYENYISKITQLKNGLIVYQTENITINFIQLSENSYEIKYTLQLKNEIFHQHTNIISIKELSDEKIAILLKDYNNDKLIFIKFTNQKYELNTYINLPIYKNMELSLDIEEIPKLNQISYFTNNGLYFFDLISYELKKKMSDLNGFEWTNCLLLYNDDYLILGSEYADCNDNSKNVYLVKCSTYEIIDSFYSNDFNYMFCTSMKLLNNKNILFGFHMYDYYSQFLEIKIENEKIVFVSLKRISNNEYDGEICGIEEFDDIIVAGNRHKFISLYK